MIIMKKLIIKIASNMLPLRIKAWINKSISHKDITKEYIAKFLPADPVVVEAGAHVGADTIEMSLLWPDATIHAFEPVPEIFHKLAKNTKRLKNIRCHNIALSSKTGKATMSVSTEGSDGSSSLLKPKMHLKISPEVKFEKNLKVKSITLDDWCLRNKIKNVDFLWLDMQGSEFSVLKKSTKILKTVKAIHMEVSNVELYQGQALYPEIKGWLAARGFTVKKHSDLRISGDVLFVRTK
jgi:FkbM family methyltransferase